tara:strand:- start:94 stop:822 length:729 start_codon:yes stop_codon:yes gene_type:complete
MNFKSVVKECAGMIYYHTFRKFHNIQGNRSLIYHAFGTRLKHDTYGISIKIQNFKEHIRYLKDNYKIISATSYSKYNADSVSITIDDGYKDTLRAIEVLDHYKIPSTIFITSNFINQHNYLTEKDLCEISKSKLFTIGAHGSSHKKLGTLNTTEQHNELKKSKIRIEEIINEKINSVSYPHGSYNSNIFAILDNLEYQYAFSSIKGLNNVSTNKYLLRRSEIISTDKVKDLNKKIKGFYDFY